ncbi:MAG: calcineurin-like phosphoesterase C-terminal domain-containing protein [Bacteroidales bacterium]|nr:calcineurin-like phosphoesterase C-terminal domain-containing protein [Bacteroidales bacterium]
MKNTLVLSLIIMALGISACKKTDNKQTKLPSFIEATDGKNQASGYVFNDENRNNIRDKNEPGIPDVAVSNGVDIVITGDDGYYGLAVPDNGSVFVIKPADWMTPLNENKLPLFYYLHRPEGSPGDYSYKGVEPTGDLPDEINFPLYEKETGEKFKVLVFGDTQPWDIEEIDYLAEDIIHELIGIKNISFGITMGDIVFDQLELFTPLNQAVAQTGIPWYNVMGNHDINYSAPEDILSGETYNSIYGPADYAFVCGKVHFIILDDIIHEDKAGSHSYVGGLRPDQFTFLENYLETVPENDMIVLNMHIPLAKKGNSFRQDDQEKLFDLLKDFPNTLSISAHTHMQENMFFHKDSTAWQSKKPHHHYNVGTTSGSWWRGMKGETGIPHTMMRDGTPNGYAIITFNDIDYTIDWKVAGSPADHRMNIHLPGAITAGSEENPLLTVNFFNGSECSELLYRVKGFGDWKNMERKRTVDPYYLLLNQRWKTFNELGFIDQWDNNPSLSGQAFPGRDLPGPQPSSHIWVSAIGTDWPAGRHTIEVRAKDMYGRVFTSYHTMRVEENNSDMLQ